MAWFCLKLRDKDALPQGVDAFQERLVLSEFPA